MKQSKDSLQLVMEKYKLATPIDSATQLFAIHSGEKNFKMILMQAGYYSIVFGLLIGIFNFLSKYGIKATFLKCKIILLTSAIGITSTSVLGGYYTKVLITEMIKSKKIKEELDNRPKVAPPSSQTLENSPKKEVQQQAPVHYTLGIEQFSGYDKKIGSKIMSLIAKHIEKTAGPNKVVVLSTQKNRRSVAKIVFGSITKIDNMQVISARIINSNDGRLLYTTSEEIATEQDIDKACRSIAQKIAEKL